MLCILYLIINVFVTNTTYSFQSQPLIVLSFVINGVFFLPLIVCVCVCNI